MKKDVKEAIKWTTIAAEAGDTGAQHNLALAYYRGEGGVPKDLEIASVWMRRAAAGGMLEAAELLTSVAPKELCQ